MMKYSGIMSSSTAQKMKVSFKGLFSKYDQIHRKLRIWSHLLKKYLKENLIFCVVAFDYFYQNLLIDVWKSPEYASEFWKRKYFRSSLSEVCYKNGVLKNFAKFTGKCLCQSLFFNNFTGLRPATLLKKRLCLVNLTKLLRTPFL